MLKEIALGSIENLNQAIEMGVDRIELNDNLSVGGLTPSNNLIEQTLKRANQAMIPVVVMVRPRAGDFNYTCQEIDKMQQSLKGLRQLGVTAVTFGAVTIDNKLDRAAMVKLIEAAQPMEVIFHMAFDAIDPVHQLSALDWLAVHHVTRVLTHGGSMQKSIEENLPHLTWLCENAPSNLMILPGGGISYRNYETIANALGVEQVHGSKIVDLSRFNTT